MKLHHALLRACLLTSVPMASLAANEPVIVEAETGSLGANLTTGTDATNNVNYITTTLNDGTNPTAGTHRDLHGHVPGRGQLRAVRANPGRPDRRQRRQLLSAERLQQHHDWTAPVQHQHRRRDGAQRRRAHRRQRAAPERLEMGTHDAACRAPAVAPVPPCGRFRRCH